jgi:hypothetical protein
MINSLTHGSIHFGTSLLRQESGRFARGVGDIVWKCKPFEVEPLKRNCFAELRILLGFFLLYGSALQSFLGERGRSLVQG